MGTASRQLGFISTKMLLIIVIGGVSVTCAFKIAPAYLDNRFVVAALRALGDGTTPLEDMTTNEITSDLKKKFALNNVRGDPVEAFEIERENDKVMVTVNYEVRTHLFYNLDVVIAFENVLDSTRPDQCCKPPKR